MDNQLVCNHNISSLQPVGINASTGLSVFQSWQGKSGFIYQMGVRESHGLQIIEGIAEGTACMFLCGIQVRDKESNKEICSVPVEYGTRYSKQQVMELVHQQLCKTLSESAIKSGRAANMKDVERQVENMLDDCYFGESRQAALSWAERVGLFD